MREQRAKSRIREEGKEVKGKWEERGEGKERKKWKEILRGGLLMT